MTIIVTGAAGFIGSTLCQELARRGQSVVGVDSFTEYYDVAVKRAHAEAVEADGVPVVERDVSSTSLDDLLNPDDVVIHLAGQPGVRLSWAGGFPEYLRQNVASTQRVLESAMTRGARRVVVASSSSIYGNTDVCPTRETDTASPFSPYGVTKLAAEHLSHAYVQNGGAPVTALRYFTVYGPRQRPDMAMHRFIESVLTGTPLTLFGDGSQRRDFTFVDDIVSATICAADDDHPGFSAVNVAGGSSMTVREVISLVESLADRQAVIEHRPSQAGDVRETGGDISRARERWGWQPQVQPEEGIARQLAWHLGRRR